MASISQGRFEGINPPNKHAEESRSIKYIAHHFQPPCTTCSAQSSLCESCNINNDGMAKTQERGILLHHEMAIDKAMPSTESQQKAFAVKGRAAFVVNCIGSSDQTATRITPNASHPSHTLVHAWRFISTDLGPWAEATKMRAVPL
eukprot:1133621-Pelagomonas_calceolata.AAC.7